MKAKKTLGSVLVDAVKGALEAKGNGKIVRARIDVAKLRKNLGMTQKEFSERYDIKLQTLRNWEQDKRMPDSTTTAYLTCIARRPKEIAKILHLTK